MSWLGVPFVSPEDWDGFPWARIEFLNQFVHAAQYRVDVMRKLAGLAPVSLGLFEAGAPAQPAAFFNHLRRFGNYKVSAEAGDRNPSVATIGSAPLTRGDWGRWFNSASITAGAAFAGALNTSGIPEFPSSWFYFNNSGMATSALLVRMNEILEDAGCPPLASATPTSNETAMGIPWTRLYGSDPESPTKAAGACQANDWIGPHIFNELWAFLVALDTLHIPGDYIAENDDGSWHKLRSMEWVERSEVVSDSCALLAGGADTDTTVQTDEPYFQIYRQSFREVYETGEFNRTTRGRSFDRQIRLRFAKPDAEYGTTITYWGVQKTQPLTLVDYEGVGTDLDEIVMIGTTADGAGLAVIEEGSLENLLTASPACVNPGVDEVLRFDSYAQRIYIGFAALTNAFPDPPH